MSGSRGGAGCGLDPRRPGAARSQWTPLARALGLVGDHWTLTIVLALAGGRRRLTELRGGLPGVSAGVLDRHLRRMAGAGLVTRRRFAERPPRVELELTEAGRELVPVATALARWGRRRAWSPPRTGELVDARALLEQLPALLADRRDLPAASLEVSLTARGTRGHGGLRLWMGRPQARRRPPRVAVSGDEQAWVSALGPAQDMSRLNVDGDRALALSILAGAGGEPFAAAAGSGRSDSGR